MTFTIRLAICFDYTVEAENLTDAIEKARESFDSEIEQNDYDFNRLCEGIETGSDLDFVKEVNASE